MKDPQGSVTLKDQGAGKPGEHGLCLGDREKLQHSHPMALGVGRAGIGRAGLWMREA
jgi:hypothetical protein